MFIPFLNRISIRKVTVSMSNEAGLQAQTILEKILADLPELLMACVVEVHSGRVVASYTTASNLNPNHISLRYAKLIRSTQTALAAQQIPGGPLTDMTLLLDNQLHTLRPLNKGQWYCFLAIRYADANLAIASDILRRHSTLN